MAQLARCSCYGQLASHHRAFQNLFRGPLMVSHGRCSMTSTVQKDIIFTMRTADHSLHTIRAQPGQKLLDLAHQFGVDEIEGVCGGNLECSTCHVKLPLSLFEKLPAPAPEEEDYLDLVPELENGRSRLACQLRIDERFDGVCIEVPSVFLNQQLAQK